MLNSTSNGETHASIFRSSTSGLVLKSRLWYPIGVFMQQQPNAGKQFLMVGKSVEGNRWIKMWRLFPDGESKWDILNNQQSCISYISNDHLYPIYPTIVKAMRASAVECISAWTWHVEPLVFYCIDVSVCSDFSYHNIITT